MNPAVLLCLTNKNILGVCFWYGPSMEQVRPKQDASGCSNVIFDFTFC